MQTQLNLRDQVGGSASVQSQSFTSGGTTYSISPSSFVGSPMLLVFVGGALLKITDDYTLSGNNTIILNTSVSSGVIVTAVWFNPSFNLGSNATSIGGYSVNASGGASVLVPTDANGNLPIASNKYAAMMSMLFGR